MIGERHIGRPRPADRPDAAQRRAETASVLCGKYSSTLRRVLKYFAASMIRYSAGLSSACRRAKPFWAQKNAVAEAFATA